MKEWKRLNRYQARREFTKGKQKGTVQLQYRKVSHISILEFIGNVSEIYKSHAARTHNIHFIANLFLAEFN